MGAVITAVLAGILAGGLGAKLLHDAYPTIAILVAPPLGMGLYVLVRAIANASGNPFLRAAVTLSATCFTIFYFVVLAGEDWRPVRSADAVVRLLQAVAFLARILGAAALAVVIAGGAAWKVAGEARRTVRPDALAPFMVSAGLGAGAFTLSMATLVASIALLPRAASLYVLVVIPFVLPLIFNGVWTYMYVRLLSRWEVEALPEALVNGLADLRSRCGFQFDRVVCLDACYGNGRVGAVTSTLRSTTLFISEPLPGVLDRHELLAILAHETAHVELRHFRRKLVFGLLATAIGFGCYMVVLMALDGLVPRNLRLAQFLLIGALYSLARSIYDTSVTRRHEREADEYAARAAGAGALLRALEKLGGGRSPIAMANRWTTHSTWEIRSRRLQDMAAREDGP